MKTQGYNPSINTISRHGYTTPKEDLHQLSNTYGESNTTTADICRDANNNEMIVAGDCNGDRVVGIGSILMRYMAIIPIATISIITTLSITHSRLMMNALIPGIMGIHQGAITGTIIEELTGFLALIRMNLVQTVSVIYRAISPLDIMSTDILLATSMKKHQRY